MLANSHGSLAAKLGEEIEVLDPEMAIRRTTKSTALKTDQQVNKAWELAKDCIGGGKMQAWTICIATTNPTSISVREILRAAPKEIIAEELTGDYIRKPETMVVKSRFMT